MNLKKLKARYKRWFEAVHIYTISMVNLSTLKAKSWARHQILIAGQFFIKSRLPVRGVGAVVMQFFFSNHCHTKVVCEGARIDLSVYKTYNFICEGLRIGANLKSRTCVLARYPKLMLGF